MTTPKSADNLFADVLKAKQADAAAAAASANPAPVVPAVPPTEPVVTPPGENDDNAPAPEVTRLDMLKSQARLMGLTFSNNIGVDALKAKIDAKLAGESDSTSEDDAVNQDEDPAAQNDVSSPSRGAYDAPAPVKPNARMNLRQQQFQEQMKLVRLRITNLNPAKKDLPGEIFTVANRVLGSVRKYVPYGEATDNGYHVPYFIYTQLQEREFLQIKTTKDSRGRPLVTSKMAREFALEVLPPLTEVELARLAATQAAASGME